MSTVNGSCNSLASQIYQQGLQRQQVENAPQNEQRPNHQAVLEPSITPVAEANKGVYIDYYV